MGLRERMTMHTGAERISVADHARAMTAKERIALAAGAIDAMSEDEKSVIRVLWEPVADPLPPMGNVMAEARGWARFAPMEQIKALAAACFLRLPASERARFIGWANGQKSE